MNSPVRELMQAGGMESFLMTYRKNARQKGYLSLNPLSKTRRGDICLVKETILSIAERKPASLEEAHTNYESIFSSLIHPEIRTIMTRTSDNVSNFYRQHGFQNAALVLVGGGIGGSLVKEYAGTYTPSATHQQDIDMLFVSTSTGLVQENVYTNLLIAVQSSVETEGKSKFKTCESINVKNKHAQNITKDTIHSLFTSDFTPGDIATLNPYWFPSFPPEVNHRNRQILIEELQELFASGKQTQWENIVDSMQEQWMANFTTFKIDYFPRETGGRGEGIEPFHSQFRVLAALEESARRSLIQSLLFATKIPPQ